MADGAALEMLCTPKGYRGFKSLPLRQSHSDPVNIDADDPLRAATAESLEPVRRRQFLCEKVEASYRQLLATATDGLDSERARAALSQAIEANLRWARKNIVGFGTGHAEYTLFVRIQELSAHYQQALQALDRTKAPATLDDVSATLNALNTKAAAMGVPEARSWRVAHS